MNKLLDIFKEMERSYLYGNGGDLWLELKAKSNLIKQALQELEELKNKVRELLNQLDTWHKPYDCGYDKWADGISDLQFDLQKLVGEDDE